MSKIITDRIKLTELQNWFSCYVDTFRFDNPELQQNIDLKKEHTARVCIEIRNLGEKLGLNEDEIRLAEIIALFHDIGRFEQYARYNTFKDRISEDHAGLGIRILRKHGILDQFDASIKEIIIHAVRYHNKPVIHVEGGSGQRIFFSRLLRDADKLDILKVVSDNYNSKNGVKNRAVELDLPDTPGFSEEVGNAIMNKSIVKIKNLKNLNDFKLLQAGWIFDINFAPTLEVIKNRHYIQMLRDVLPESREIDVIFDFINSFLQDGSPYTSIPRI
jgi:putative nucleotidyltransferase with HDIG domain